MQHLDDAVSALKTKQIDAIVIDTPTAQYMASQQGPNGTVVGQFPTTGEHIGLLFAKDNPLVGRDLTLLRTPLEGKELADALKDLKTTEQPKEQPKKGEAKEAEPLPMQLPDAGLPRRIAFAAKRRWACNQGKSLYGDR